MNFNINSGTLPAPFRFAVERRETIGDRTGILRYPGEFADESSAVTFAAAKMTEECGADWWREKGDGYGCTVLGGRPAGIPDARLHITVIGRPNRVTHSCPVPADSAMTPHYCIADDAFGDRCGGLADGTTRECPRPVRPPEPPAATFGNEVGRTFV